MEEQLEAEVTSHETVCPFANVVLVNIELSVPAFVPLTFH
jgi:hypothetical protein